jgi:hypothetical protein
MLVQVLFLPTLVSLLDIYIASLQTRFLSCILFLALQSQFACQNYKLRAVESKRNGSSPPSSISPGHQSMSTPSDDSQVNTTPVRDKSHVSHTDGYERHSGSTFFVIVYSATFNSRLYHSTCLATEISDLCERPVVTMTKRVKEAQGDHMKLTRRFDIPCAA